MTTPRRAAVAGTFYSSDPRALRRELEGYLSTETAASPAIAVVSPHAGTMYSGPTAGQVFSRVLVPETAVVAGVNHRDPLAPPLALYPDGAWQTPLGSVEVDAAFARRWVAACPALSEDRASHAAEHSLEVQIPFLQSRNPDVRIVPLMVSTHDARTREHAGRALAETVRKPGHGVLLVASTDMTHFENQAAAEEKDRQAIEAILALDPDRLLDVVLRRRISMCGVAPTALILYAARALGAARAELADYRTSADATGDRSQVVGYAGVVIT